MSFSQEYESVVGFATTLITLAGVAVIGREVVGAVFHHSIPPGELDRIAKKYGCRAARRAEASVPHMDVEACEREAKRLYETVRYRH